MAIVVLTDHSRRVLLYAANANVGFERWPTEEISVHFGLW